MVPGPGRGPAAPETATACDAPSLSREDPMSRRPIPIAAALACSLALACAAEGPPAGDEGVRLVEGSRAPAPEPAPTLALEAPEPGAAVEGDSLAARLTLEGFALAEPTPGAEARGLAKSSRGQHVHFIVDERPYRAIYDLGGPVSVDLSDLEPGLHLLRAFPSRQWHESVKTEGAFARSWFLVGDTAAAADFDPDAPALTYSRPKGSYAGADADSVMVDFYLANAELGPGQGQHRVRLTVDDTLDWELVRWAPHYVLGLDEGPHTFRLELLAPDGSVVPGDHNATEREIVVEAGGGQDGG